MSRILDFDADQMRQNFAREPFAVLHDLADHPLLKLDRIAQLSDFPGRVAGGSENRQRPRRDAGRRDRADPGPAPGEIVRGIETNG